MQHGIFTKGERTREANSPGEAVRLVYDGWTRVAGAVAQDQDNAPPPRSGAGSGRDAWAAYALEHDVPVPDDAHREDIITALDAAGVATEPPTS